MLTTQFNAFFFFSLTLFSGITTKKKTPQADTWVLSSASIAMCALDEAESLVVFPTHSHDAELGSLSCRRGYCHWKNITSATRSVHKPFSARQQGHILCHTAYLHDVYPMVQHAIHGISWCLCACQWGNTLLSLCTSKSTRHGINDYIYRIDTKKTPVLQHWPMLIFTNSSDRSQPGSG